MKISNLIMTFVSKNMLKFVLILQKLM